MVALMTVVDLSEKYEAGFDYLPVLEKCRMESLVVVGTPTAEDVAAGRLEEVLPESSPAAVPVHVVHRESGHVSARVRVVLV